MRGAFLFRQPLRQVQERGRLGGHEGSAVVIAHFNQLAQRALGQRAQPRQQSIVFRRPAAG
jgi:hypothetical protein